MRRAFRQKHSAGETLVETIVSFAVVLLTLATITAVVQLAIRLNGRAMEQAEALEASASVIESGTGGDGAPGRLRLRIPDGNNGTERELPITVYPATDTALGWFEPVETGGG